MKARIINAISATEADDRIIAKFPFVRPHFSGSFLRYWLPTIKTLKNTVYFNSEDVDKILAILLPERTEDDAYVRKFMRGIIDMNLGHRTATMYSLQDVAESIKADLPEKSVGAIVSWFRDNQNAWFSDQSDYNERVDVPSTKDSANGTAYKILVSATLKEKMRKIAIDHYRNPQVPVITKPTLDGVNMAALSSAEVDTLMALLAKIKQ